jgi:hypothetical protein
MPAFVCGYLAIFLAVSSAKEIISVAGFCFFMPPTMCCFVCGYLAS